MNTSNWIVEAAEIKNVIYPAVAVATLISIPSINYKNKGISVKTGDNPVNAEIRASVKQ